VVPKNNLRRLYLAKVYLNALRNEIAFDIDGYAAAGKTPSKFAYMPRFSAIWPRIANKPLFLSSNSARFLSFIWRRGFYIPFFVIQYLSLRMSMSDSMSDESDESFHILLSALAPQLIARAEGADRRAFTVPWQRYPDGIPHGKHVSLEFILSRSDLRSCLIDAIAIARRIAKRRTQFYRWHLQTYTLFRWLCVARALEKMACKRMVMANHYDRWAVLIDRLGGRTGRPVTIVQHGVEEVRHLPTKLRFVDILYVFNQKEASLFKEFILASPARERVVVRFFNNSIMLSKVEDASDRVVVVLVGHPEHDGTHLRFLDSALTERPDVRFIYKPHPTARGINPAIARMTERWDENGRFPKGDFVFSYRSTLAYQYREAGILTYIHGASLSDEEISTAIAMIPKEPSED